MLSSFGNQKHHDYSSMLVSNFEKYLNLEEELKGGGDQFEIVAFGPGATFYGGAEFSWLAGTDPKNLEINEPDEILFLIHPMTVLWETLSFFKTPSKDGIPKPWKDPSFIVLSEKEKLAQLTPNAEKLRKFLFKNQKRYSGSLSFPDHGKWPVIEENWKIFEYLDDPEFYPFIDDAIGLVLNKLQARIGTAKRISVILLPYRNYLSVSEMSSGTNSAASTSLDRVSSLLENACKKYGIQYTSLVSETRKLEPSLFPIFAIGDPHLNYQGHQWMAYLCAKRYIEMTGR
jgi:hypothetical protein